MNKINFVDPSVTQVEKKNWIVHDEAILFGFNTTTNNGF